MTDDVSPRTCYRHPDRETRLACSNCGRSICVECSRDAAVGQKCPDCSAPEGRHKVITAAQMRQTRSGSPVTYALIAINVLIFVAGEFDRELGLRMFFDGAHLPTLVSAGEWWRAFTAMFLHGGITHVLFNMWALYAFGPAVEHRFGSASFVSLYLACGLGGSAAYQVVGRDAFAVGASGAIFGLMGALVASAYRQRFSAAGRAVFSQLLLLLGINLALPAIVPNIAWEAHIGGLVAGIVISAAWDRLPMVGQGAVGRRVSVAASVAIIAMAIVLLA